MNTNNQFLKDCTILIVDDEMMIQRSVLQMFSTTPANILAAPNAAIGIKLAQQKEPDLILLDWNMPGMSGIEALKELKKDVNTRQIPVIIMTALAISSIQSYEALTTGADDFLKKPFDAYELLGRICAVLRQTQAKKQIEEQNKALKKYSDDQSKLLSILSHDLKSPLNNIEALVDLTKIHLTQNSIGEEAQNYLALITKVVRQERNLINEILEMHEFEDAQYQEEYYPIQLNDWLDEQLQPFQSNTKNIGIEYSNDKNLLIHSSPLLLKKVVDNLVSNSLKYSYSNTVIQITLEDKNDSIQLCIKDQGQGFHPNEIDQAFQKFCRLSAQPTGGEYSSGIGLYIVKSIVDQLGGSIQLNSTFGKGSEFIITLPKNTPEEEIVLAN